MLAPILKSNIAKITKNITLAMAIVLGFSLSTKAEETQTYETLEISCNPFLSYGLNSECDLNLAVESETDIVAQTRRGRRRKSKVQGYYGGFSLGVGFPSGELDFGDIPDIEFSDPEYDTTFLGSLFGGIKFTKSISADLEFLLALGGVDSDSLENGFNDFAAASGVEGSLSTDGDFSAFAFYINPRFELPLSKSGNFNVYITPGIGLSQTNVNFEAVSNFPALGDQNLNTSIKCIEI